MAALPRAFFARDARTVARELLGTTLVRRFEDGTIATGRIVETEAYLKDDPACHAFRGETKRNRTMFSAAGYAYIHLNYGLHWCLNAVTGEVGDAEAALIRAVEPVTGIERLWENYSATPTGASDRRIGAGPGRIGRAFQIDRQLEAADLCDVAGAVFLADGLPVPDDDVTTATRIGITKGADFLWRYYVTSSKWVSRR